MDLINSQPELKKQFDEVENSYLLFSQVIFEKRSVLRQEFKQKLLSTKYESLMLEAWKRVPNSVNVSILNGINRARKDMRPKLAAILQRREEEAMELELKRKKEEEDRKQKALMEEFKRKEKLRQEKEEEERKKMEEEERKKVEREAAALLKPSVLSAQRQDLEAALLRKGLYLIKSMVDKFTTGKDVELLNQVRKVIRTSLGQVTNDSDSIMTHTAIIDNVIGKAKDKDQVHYLFALNSLAKLVMAQATTELISTAQSGIPKASFPLARLVLSLVNSNSDILPILMIRFYKRVPYIYPRSLPDLTTGTELYFQRLDYYLDDSGEFETQDGYDKRSESIFRLYCCMMQFDVTDGYRINLGIETSWTWLKSFTSIQPPPLISSTLLNTFFETVGYKFVHHYKTNAIKFIRAIDVSYIPTLSQEAVAANTKFQVTLDNFFKNNNSFSTPTNRDFMLDTDLLDSDYESDGNGDEDEDEEDDDDPYGLGSVVKKW